MMFHGIERVDPSTIKVGGNVEFCAGIFGNIVAEDKDRVGLLDLRCGLDNENIFRLMGATHQTV
jgi:hypothetical protein